MGAVYKLTTDEAIELALSEEYEVSVTSETMRSWCVRYKIGKKIGGRWKINKKRLILILEGRSW
jgi:hypothetical protein